MNIRHDLYEMNRMVEVMDAGTFLGELGDVYAMCGDVRLAVSTCVQQGWMDGISGARLSFV